MKKLALILGSLLVVGTVTQAKEIVAAPTTVETAKEVVVVAEPMVETVEVVTPEQPALRVTNVGQYIEIDNNSGDSDGNVGNVMLGNQIGLATDNWTFGVMARKSWITDTDNGFGKTGSRIDLDAWRNFQTEGGSTYSLGTRWRQESNTDKFYLRGKYQAGMFSGWADGWYAANEADQDNYEIEIMPLNVTLGPVTLGYYFDGQYGVGSTTAGQSDINTTVHQLRAYFPIFTAGNLSATGEYRFGLNKNDKRDNTQSYEFAQMNRAQVSLNYQYKENLSFSTYYLYEITKPKQKESVTSNKYNYYGEFGLGWNYSF